VVAQFENQPCVFVIDILIWHWPVNVRAQTDVILFSPDMNAPKGCSWRLSKGNSGNSVANDFPSFAARISIGFRYRDARRAWLPEDPADQLELIRHAARVFSPPSLATMKCGVRTSTQGSTFSFFLLSFLSSAVAAEQGIPPAQGRQATGPKLG